MNLIRGAIRGAYLELIYHRRREAQFWILAAFVPTFLAARLLVHFTPSLFLNVQGTHIHHFIYGIIILAAVGYVAIVYPGKSRRVLAAVYGAGVAMAADEFGMWLHLTDDYQVRQSYDAIILIGAFLISVVYFADFWGRIFRLLRLR